MRKSVDSILRWESIILDPIGPILALTAFYVYQIFEQGFGVQIILIFILKMVITGNWIRGIIHFQLVNPT